MATATQSPDSYLINKLGELHPDYTVGLYQPVNEVYPYLTVTNGKQMVNTQIRLAKNYWTVTIIDRLVAKAIKKIEAAPKSNVGDDK